MARKNALDKAVEKELLKREALQRQVEVCDAVIAALREQMRQRPARAKKNIAELPRPA